MGSLLSEPVANKESASNENSMYCVGSSCMQGWRETMEDGHTHILSIREDSAAAFFAVYDGHGGGDVSKFVAEYMHNFVLNRPEYPNDICAALKEAFLDIDNYLLFNFAWGYHSPGSTANVVLLRDNCLYCANAGDSRAVASVNGSTLELSYDHKPCDAPELKRILDAGGFVRRRRVNGRLALSRALGDFQYKCNAQKTPQEQAVTAYPDVSVNPINTNWEFILLACDGIWNVMSSSEVVNFCCKRIGRGLMPEKICEELIDRCHSRDFPLGSVGGDNITVVLVCLLHNKPYATLVQRCLKYSKQDP